MNIEFTRMMAEVILYMRQNSNVFILYKKRRGEQRYMRTESGAWVNIFSSFQVLMDAKLITADGRVGAYKRFYLSQLGKEIVVPPPEFLDGPGLDMQ